MGKTAKTVASSDGVADNNDVVQNALNILNPKRQFLVASMNMGWQLAGVVLIPVAVGVKLDDHFDSSPSYTLAALMLAAIGAASVVWNTIKQVNREQAESELKEKKRAK